MDTNVSLSDGTHNNIVIQNWTNAEATPVRISLKVGTTAPDTSGAKTFAAVENFKKLAWLWRISASLRNLHHVHLESDLGLRARITAPAEAFQHGDTFSLGECSLFGCAVFEPRNRDEHARHSGQQRIHHEFHPSLVYDVYFTALTWEAPMLSSLDIRVKRVRRAMMFGTECRTEGNRLWAVWDNPNQRWVIPRFV